MIRRSVVPLLTVLAALFLAACGSSGGGGNDLTGVVWQWSAMQETAPAHLSMVPDPENYTIQFNTDGRIDLKADCNMGGGTYSLNGDSLTIQVESMTMAYCGDDSQDQIYLSSLAKVASYAIVDGSLQLIFPDDGGKMDFNNGGTAQ